MADSNPNRFFRYISQGSFGTGIIASGEIPMGNPVKISPIKLRLLPRQEKLLKQHSKGHTKRYIEYMRQLMIIGVPFNQAHQKTKRFIGN